VAERKWRVGGGAELVIARVLALLVRHLRGRSGALLLSLLAASGAGLVLSGALDPVSIDRGPLLWVAVSLAVVLAGVNLATRSARWWLRRAPWLALVTTGMVVVAWQLLQSSGLTGDSSYPAGFVLLAWLALFVLGAGLSELRRDPPGVATARCLSGPAAILATLLWINAFYGYWPTAGALLGDPFPGQVSATQISAQLAGYGHPPAPSHHPAPNTGNGLTHTVAAPTAREGTIGPVSIPGRSVGFRAALAYLWLPPDWSSVSHSDLPVIVTLTGIPGRALNWAWAGGAVEISDAWAAAHHGHAPPVLMLEQNGAAQHDTECLDSREGQSFSYLSEVVPAWITHHLGIAHDPDRWGLVGFSEGGTCALLLSVLRPHLFSRFIDIAGDAAPDFGPGGRLTLRNLYNGNRAARAAHDPEVLMRTHRYPGVDAWFSTGLQDPVHNHLEPLLAAAARRAGMEVHTYWAAGGHTWRFAQQAFREFYPGFVRTLYAGRGSPQPSCRRTLADGHHRAPRCWSVPHANPHGHHPDFPAGAVGSTDPPPTTSSPR
jgi:S-formylglutathione hydrolase FrmB